MNYVNSVSPNWKYAAIVLALIVVVESYVLFWSYDVGSRMMRQEALCSKTCGNMADAVSYSYDSTLEICECMNAYGGSEKVMDMRGQ